MWNRLSVVTPGAAPVTVADVKTHCRIDVDDEDALLARFIAGAMARVDGPRGIGWAMMQQTWRLTLDGFPYAVLELPGAPVKSVAAVQYVDGNGVAQTVDPADYRLDVDHNPARLTPAFGKRWPTARDVVGAVTVDYVLGEANAADVPADLIDAIHLLVGHRYENREAAAVNVNVIPLPMGFDSIVSEYRQATAA